MSKGNLWTETELYVLKTNYSTNSRQELINLLPCRTWNAMEVKAYKLGLRRPLFKIFPLTYGNQGKRKLLLTKVELQQFYHGEGLSTLEIAKQHGVSGKTIINYMKTADISIRTYSEASRLRPLKGYKPYFSEEAKRQLAKARIGKTNPALSERNRRDNNLRPSPFTDPEVKRKALLKLMQRPTKPEQQLIDLSKAENLPYKYVGNGLVIIGGRCPDFININGEKRVIEIFGEYWHNPRINKNVRKQAEASTTKAHYQEYGFACLIIWDYELQNIEATLQRISKWED